MLIPAIVTPILLRAGITTRPAGPDTVELTHPDGSSPPARVRVVRRATPLSPSHVRHITGHDRVLLVVPHASPAALREAERANVSVLETGSVEDPSGGGHVVFPTGTVQLGPPTTPTRSQPTRRGPRPWGTFAVLRQILAGTPAGQVEMGAQAGISQGRVSQTLGHMVALGLVARNPTGDGPRWVADDWDALASWWMHNYPGPGGLTTFWFGLTDVVQQARSAVDALGRVGIRTALSGDVAADLIAPWRRPGRAVVYADVAVGSSGVDLATAGLTPASVEDASLELIVPEDRSVWRPAGDENPLADGMQVLWDLARSPGSDTDQAVATLRRALRPDSADLPRP